METPTKPGPLTVTPRAPRWLRYGWAVLVTLTSVGGWVVDHCTDNGPIGSVLQSLWGARHPAPRLSQPVAPSDRPRAPAVD